MAKTQRNPQRLPSWAVTFQASSLSSHGNAVPIRSFTLVIALLLIHGSPALAEDPWARWADLCQYNADQLRVLQDAEDGRLDEVSLFRASLLAAGHSLAEARLWEVEFAAFVRRCRARLSAISPTGRQRQLFAQLQQECLSGAYQADLCDVSQTISGAAYNCLTATILYQRLCAEFGITAEALWEPAHVRCWVVLAEGEGLTVETTATTPRDALGERGSRAQVMGRFLSRTELLGKVLYNQGVQALRREDYSTALATTWASLCLDPEDAPAASNVRACLNNWALWAVQHDDLAFARRLLVAGNTFDPDYVPFRRNLSLLSRGS